MKRSAPITFQSAQNRSAITPHAASTAASGTSAEYHSPCLHIVDLDATGPSFDELAFKNLPLDDCLQVLSKELRELRMRRKPSARFEKTADGGILEKTAADDGPTRVAAADFVTPRR